MKLTVKTLKASHFEIEVQPSDTVIAVKKVIEETKGKESFPCAHQLLIYNGKVLKDETTLEDNKVREDGFVVVMLSKSKILGTGGSSSSQAAAPAPAPAPASASAPTTTPAPAPAPGPAAPAAAPPAVPDVQPRQAELQTQGVADVYGHAASTLVGGENLEPTIQQLLEMGGGSWDRETVVRALRAAYNNPERAVDYLYSGIPATAEVAVPVARVPSSPAQNLTADASRETDVAGLAPPVTGPNASPLNLFPQGTPNFGAGTGGGSLDFLRNNQQFVNLRSMIQSNPQILQPMLQELSKQNPQLLRQIQDHQAEFLQLLNEQLDEPEGLSRDLFEQLEQDMPQSVSVTPEEQEAIARLEAMGFDRALVIEAYLACDRNEELAANYLLENAGDFED